MVTVHKRNVMDLLMTFSDLRYLLDPVIQTLVLQKLNSMNEERTLEYSNCIRMVVLYLAFTLKSY